MAEELQHYHNLKATNPDNKPIKSDILFKNTQELHDGGLMDEDEELDQQDMDVDDETEDKMFIEMFEGATESFPGETTFMDEFDKDPHALECILNLYYPFVS